MATNIQQNSQNELKTHLEERLRTQFPSASSQDIVNAAEIAMGRRGYVLHADQRNQQSTSQPNEQQRNNQQDSVRRDNMPGQQQALASVVAVREAAISAAQAISEPMIKMAAIASAWVAFASTNAAHEQSQQKIGRN